MVNRLRYWVISVVVFSTLRYSAFGLIGLATILASSALKFDNIQTGLNITIVIVTATAGILASIEGLRKPSELWINERNVLYALLDLQRDLEYELAETETLKNPDLYFNKLQQILGESKEK